MNMLNRNCKTSFAKPEFLKKAQRANPRLYDIGCYNDNLALMLAPESDKMIRRDKELDVPSELPKVSLVNASLKKLKFHLTQFDSVVKKRTTPNALKEGKEIVENVVHIPSANNIASGMFKLDLEPLPPRNDRISQTPSRNMKNKVEAQPRKVNKKNCVVEPICDDNVKHLQLNANSDLNCATCKKSLFDDVHDKCLLDFVKTMNSHAKSAKKHKKQNI
ncbi:hypothetical protein Tco_0174172 [Tanacetum coccineum]